MTLQCKPRPCCSISFIFLLDLILVLAHLFIIVDLPCVDGSSSSILSCDPSNKISGDLFCSRNIRSGSICHPLQRVCTNPYHHHHHHYDRGGCLTNTDTDSTRRRVCSDYAVVNSNNDNESISSSTKNCTLSPFYDDEIRIYAGPSDSSLVLAWIYQILLMEGLQVPVAVVSSSSLSPSSENDNDGWDFYHPFNSFPIEIPQPMGGQFPATIANTVDHDDHREGQEETMLLSFDAIPLVGSHPKDKGNENDDHGDEFEITGTGLWGQTNLYVPRITAQRYPGLLSYYGLQQQPKQQSLAEIFSKPFTWSEYCETISTTNCQQPDDVAQRRPTTTEEATSYYFHDHDDDFAVFRGYFGTVHEQRSNNSSSSNNSNNNSSNNSAVGHVIAPSSCKFNYYNDIGSQLYWNNISLQPQGPLEPDGGYEMVHMIQIWKAANATGSNVLMWWWTPDSLVEAFAGTDYAFVPILLPDQGTNPECHSSSLGATNTIIPSSSISTTVEDRCRTSNFKERNRLVCGDPGREMRKAISNSLKEQPQQTISNAKMDPIHRNPAYETIHNLRITNKDLREILQHWGKARYQPQQLMQQPQQTVDDNNNHQSRLGFQSREAVCLWVTQHLEELEAAFPPGYPQVVSQQQSNWSDDAPYLIAAQVVGATAALVVMLTGIATVHWKGRMVVVYAQLNFVWLVLLGLWFISLTAILHGKEPTDNRCLLAEWLSTMGYTFVMVPLVVKIATINHIAQTMQRTQSEQGNSNTNNNNETVVIRISPIKMFLVEVGLSLCVIMYLMVWTAYDPPSRMETQVLTGEDGNVVETTISCSSKADGWKVAILCWQGALLVCATVLATLSEQVVKDFKESRNLGQLIYCQDLFLVMRVILFLNRDALEPNVYNAILSFFLSTDALLSTAIYFVPLLLRLAAGNDLDNAAAQVGETMTTGTNNRQNDIGMGSTNSADLSILIQNRIRDASGTLAEDGGSDFIDAQCSRGALSF